MPVAFGQVTTADELMMSAVPALSDVPKCGAADEQWQSKLTASCYSYTLQDNVHNIICAGYSNINYVLPIS